MSFFDLPPSAINAAALDEFLSEQLPEGINLDYKRELTDSVYETIAAMANTYGGIILVGVDEDKSFDPALPIFPPRGVKRGDRERLVNKAYTLLQPPFVFDVKAVEASNGVPVLVIRVDPGRLDRPIVIAERDVHRVLFRLEGRNAPADRTRMAALFAEAPGAAAATAGPGNWEPQTHGRYPVDDMTRSTLVARIAVEASVPYDRLETAVIDGPVIDAFDDALRDAPLTRWLEVASSIPDVHFDASWNPLSVQHMSTSGLRMRRWRGAWHAGGSHMLDLPYGAQGALHLPYGLRAFSGRVALTLDATFDPDPAVAALQDADPAIPSRLRYGFSREKEKLTIGQLYKLIMALVDSALDVVAPATFAPILGMPAWERIGPTAYLGTQPQRADRSYAGIGSFLSVDRYIEQDVPPKPRACQHGPNDDPEDSAIRDDGRPSRRGQRLVDSAPARHGPRRVRGRPREPLKGYRGQRGMPERPHARPTAIRTIRFPSAPGPRLAARAVAESRAARKSIEVREATDGVYGSSQTPRVDISC